MNTTQSSPDNSFAMEFANRIGQLLGLPAPIDLNVPFEDLGLDSLDIVEILQHADDMGAQVSVDDLADIRNGHDVVFLAIQRGAHL